MSTIGYATPINTCYSKSTSGVIESLNVYYTVKAWVNKSTGVGAVSINIHSDDPTKPFTNISSRVRREIVTYVVDDMDGDLTGKGVADSKNDPEIEMRYVYPIACFVDNDNSMVDYLDDQINESSKEHEADMLNR